MSELSHTPNPSAPQPNAGATQREAWFTPDAECRGRLRPQPEARSLSVSVP